MINMVRAWVLAFLRECVRIYFLFIQFYLIVLWYMNAKKEDTHTHIGSLANERKHHLICLCHFFDVVVVEINNSRHCRRREYVRKCIFSWRSVFLQSWHLLKTLFFFLVRFPFASHFFLIVDLILLRAYDICANGCWYLVHNPEIIIPHFFLMSKRAVAIAC